MKTFTHKGVPWEGLTKYNGQSITGTKPCYHLGGCRKRYKNLHEVCDGNRFIIQDEGPYTIDNICPCALGTTRDTVQFRLGLE